MTEESASHDTTGSEPARPVLSDDGIGISLEDARNLLAMKHQTVVGIDDPILMVVTLNNAFISQQEALFCKHQAALKTLMSTELSAFTTETDKIMEDIKSITASAVVEESIVQLERMTKLRRDMTWLSAIAFVSALSMIITLIILNAGLLK